MRALVDTPNGMLRITGIMHVSRTEDDVDGGDPVGTLTLYGREFASVVTYHPQEWNRVLLVKEECDATEEPAARETLALPDAGSE